MAFDYILEVLHKNKLYQSVKKGDRMMALLHLMRKQEKEKKEGSTKSPPHVFPHDHLLCSEFHNHRAVHVVRFQQ